MDILSHGLWGAIPFYKKEQLSYWSAFLFGMLPDAIAFAPHMVGMINGSERHALGESPPLDFFHPLTFTLYNFTHSAIVFLAVFFTIFLIRKRFFWELSAWGLHIIMDIPTHSYKFFSTPVLWPFSTWKFDGFSWGQSWFIIINYSLLAVIYIILYFRKNGGDDGT